MSQLLFWISGIVLGAGFAMDNTEASGGIIALGVVLTIVAGIQAACDSEKEGDKCSDTSTSLKTGQ